MKKIYYLKIVGYGTSYNAGYKLPEDLYKLMKSYGFGELKCHIQIGKNKVVKLIQLIKDVYTIYKKIDRNTKVIYQYPEIINCNFILDLLSLKKHTKVAIVIDVNSLRIGNCIFSKEDKKNLNKFDELIVHTQAIKDKLSEECFNPNKIKISYIYDYLTDSPNIINRRNSNEICYAGNLDKSIFLRAIPTNNRLNNCTFLLYGAESKNIEHGKNIVYKGTFNPNDISKIEGNWGLVWDGETLDSCNGQYGSYLRYNLPHKICLYCAAELPIIIWEEAAMANFILEHKIGITVKSINDIPDRLELISNEEYNKLLNNVKEYSKKVRSGKLMFKWLK